MASTDEPKPVYALVGTDAFLRDQNRREILRMVIADGDAQTCVETCDAESELAEVLDALRTGGLLAPRRAVVVRDADAFISRYRQQLENYLEHPASTGVLIFIVDSLPANTRLAKAIKKIGQVRDCKSPSARELPAQLVNLAAERDATLSRQAAQMLVQTVGSDLAQLVGEIDKLATYVGRGGQITLEAISQLVTSTAGPAAFDLTNALTAGDTAAALDALSGMLATRGEEFRALGMIGWHLRKSLRAADMYARGAGPGQICSELKIPRFQQQALTGLLKRRSVGQFHEDFRRLLRADLAMKTGAGASAAMRDLVVALCS
jgi:DNA polymerase-3 subunit delta